LTKHYYYFETLHLQILLNALLCVHLDTYHRTSRFWRRLSCNHWNVRSHGSFQRHWDPWHFYLCVWIVWIILVSIELRTFHWRCSSVYDLKM